MNFEVYRVTSDDIDKLAIKVGEYFISLNTGFKEIKRGNNYIVLQREGWKWYLILYSYSYSVKSYFSEKIPERTLLSSDENYISNLYISSGELDRSSGTRGQRCSVHVLYSSKTFLYYVGEYNNSKWATAYFGFSKALNIITGEEESFLINANYFYVKDKIYNNSIGTSVINGDYSDYVVLRELLINGSSGNDGVLPLKCMEIYSFIKSWEAMPSGLYKINGKTGFLLNSFFYIDL